MDLEAVVLTGGASRRMGVDKASIQVDGVAMGRRIAFRLLDAGVPPTILGKGRLKGLPFQRDRTPFEGPLSALRDFKPAAPLVFVAACDLPHFDPGLVELLRRLLGDADAAVPTLGGKLQPLCALYRSDALASLHKPPLKKERSMMGFLKTLRVAVADEATIRKAGLDPLCVRGANTPEELERLLRQRP